MVLDVSKIDFKAACLHYKKILDEATSKRLLEDVELDFLADLEMNLLSYKDLYFTYICN